MHIFKRITIASAVACVMPFAFASVNHLSPVKVPGLNQALAGLPTTGKFVVAPDTSAYLKISDKYINNAFALLKKSLPKSRQMCLHKDFGAKGGDIAIYYKDLVLPSKLKNYVGKTYSFSVKPGGIQEFTEIQHKPGGATKIDRYYILGVKAPSLIAQLRKNVVDIPYFEKLSIGIAASHTVVKTMNGKKTYSCA